MPVAVPAIAAAASYGPGVAIAGAVAAGTISAFGATVITGLAELPASKYLRFTPRKSLLNVYVAPDGSSGPIGVHNWTSMDCWKRGDDGVTRVLGEDERGAWEPVTERVRGAIG
jgi:hypothetical protein